MLPFDALDTAWDDALFESAPIPMAIVAATHRFARCNSAYCALVGYSRSELLARNWQSITHPDDVAGDQSGADSTQLDPEHNTYTVAKRYLTKRGEVVWVDLFVRAIWTDGKFQCYFVTAIKQPGRADASESKRAEPDSIMDWARKHPGDAALVGALIGAMIGRDNLIDIIKTIVSK